MKGDTSKLDLVSLRLLAVPGIKCVSMLVCSPNVQAYGHPIAAKMPLIPYCPKSLYCMAVILRCLDTTARLHGYGAGFKLLMTLYNERWRLFLKCASEMGQIISVQLSLHCWKLVPMLSVFPGSLMFSCMELGALVYSWYQNVPLFCEPSERTYITKQLQC